MEKNSVGILPIGKVQVKEGFNPRKDFSLTDVFLNSIKTNGILHPIDVRTDTGVAEFVVVDGERRLHAAQQLGLATVPVRFLGVMEEREALLYAILSGVEHRPLSSKETNQAAERLRGMGMKVKEIAERLGRSPQKIREILVTLRKGSPKLKEAIREDKIPTRVARKIANQPRRTQDRLVEEVKDMPQAQALAVVKPKPFMMKERPLKKMDLLKRDPYAIPKPRTDKFEFVVDALERVKLVNELLDRKIHYNPRPPEYRTLKNFIEVLRGLREPDQVFALS
jgi:ParB/RepB/Spo0J family partition protein